MGRGAGVGGHEASAGGGRHIVSWREEEVKEEAGTWRRKGVDPPGDLGYGGGFRSARESYIEKGWVPTRGEVEPGFEASAVGLVEEGGSACSDGAETEVGIHEGATDEV